VAALVLVASARLVPIAADQAIRVPIGLLFLAFILILYSYCAVQILSVLLEAKDVTHNLIVMVQQETVTREGVGSPSR